jgi:hypothetical protein
MYFLFAPAAVSILVIGFISLKDQFYRTRRGETQPHDDVGYIAAIEELTEV